MADHPDGTVDIHHVDKDSDPPSYNGHDEEHRNEKPGVHPNGVDYGEVDVKPHELTPSAPVYVVDHTEEQGTGCFGDKGGCFHTCHPLPSENNIIDYKSEDRSCWFRIPALSVRLNPVVTISSLALIWGFVAFCVAEPDLAGETFTLVKRWITYRFTWLYIGSQDLWAILIVMIYFSKYANVKLGKDDEKPEYSDATWFTMLFACGVGVGLFFFGVAEPIWHYDKAGGGNRYIADAYMPDNTLAQIAMNVTFYHWGIHAWIVYCIVGMLMGIVSYRLDLPMTVKSCFYPLIGDKIYGWMGDAIDTLSIMTTLFGVCTSLGLGTIQLNTGLNILNPDIPIGRESQVIIIWCITAIATMSTLSGIGLGIRRISELCFGVGMFLMMMVFFLDNSWFILNLYCQSLGYYFQWILQLGFHCDAFEQIEPSYGGMEGRNRIFEDTTSDGPSDWMDWWTVFYWGWWISWSPFVGMFIAKISRGRTLRQFINGTMTAPCVYSFAWLTIFGGLGIKLERNAAAAGLCCGHNFNMDLNTTMALPDIMLGLDGLGSWACLGDDCNDCSQSILINEGNSHNSSYQLIDRLQNYRYFGLSTDDRSLTRLSCHSKEEMWFDLMQSYGDLGGFLSIFSMCGIILYFVTSSDSGSFVIDCLAANGDVEPPRGQRVFWALTEGATATALLWVGGQDSLNALQTVSVAAGLPYTIILCFMSIALWRALLVDGGDMDPHGPQFAVGIFDVIARPTTRSVCLTLANLIIAPYSFAKAAYHADEDQSNKNFKIIFYTTILGLLLTAFVAFHIAIFGVAEIWVIGWVCYCAFACAGGATRIGLRSKYGIEGNMIEDIFCGLLMYPFTAYQVSETVDFYQKRSMEVPMEHLGAENAGYVYDNERL